MGGEKENATKYYLCAYIHDILQLFIIRIRIGKFLTLDTIPIISVHKIRDRS